MSKKKEEDIKEFFSSSDAISYEGIKKLKEKAGLTEEHLQKCMEIHSKKKPKTK